ncbi:MAG: ABC transporter ATP-binding protein, partial [Spirochaetales bacterium]|nr:ABC transporter ATP-binding protein [Spirochaetales bacterium]
AALLVLDEPAAHLDPGRQMELMELLRNLARSGKAVIVSAHDVNAARRFADTVVLVGHDGATTFGQPAEVLTPEKLEDAYDTSFVHGSHESYGAYVLPLSRKRRILE